jgi:hypothetical protein
MILIRRKKLSKSDDSVQETPLICVLKKLSEDEQEYILSLLLGSGSKSRAAIIKKTNRIAYAAVIDFICKKIRKLLEDINNDKRGKS